jgi:hypothetical protein
MRNQKLFVDVYNDLRANPAKWNQSDWKDAEGCHCFGGWLLIRAGLWNRLFCDNHEADNLPDIKVETVADFLDCDNTEALQLVDGNQTLDDIRFWFNFYNTDPNYKLL